MKAAIVLVVSMLLLGGAMPPAGAADKPRNRPSWLPSADRALMIAAAGESVTLSWRSQVGKLYTIMYTDKPQGQAVWSPLPGYVRMPGTGRTEELKFRADPAQPRRYNLHIEDAKPAKGAK